MRDLSLRTLFDLAVAEVEDPDKHVLQMYQWHFDRSMFVVRSVLTVTGTLLAALIVGYLRAELKVPIWQVCAALGGAGMTAWFGYFRYRQLCHIHEEYVSALSLMRSAMAIKPFLNRYRGT